MTKLAYADTAYFTQFSCRDELQLRNKLSRVGGAAGEMENKAKLSLNWVWAGALAELGKNKKL